MSCGNEFDLDHNLAILGVDPAAVRVRAVRVFFFFFFITLKPRVG